MGHRKSEIEPREIKVLGRKLSEVTAEMDRELMAGNFIESHIVLTGIIPRARLLKYKDRWREDPKTKDWHRIGQ